ncbi:MAG: ABC transporter substrate-binding protein [Gemmatimonadetes bacterium]|nr:ABC transporter substrate-binding protein [Gemmatimonadota bacterium]
MRAARLLWFPLFLLLPAGCAESGGKAESAAAILVRDDAGRLVRLERPARRVVCLIPSVTELILALGAGDRLVARTDYDDQPALAALPTVGGGLTPNLESLAALRPELVVGWVDAQSRTVIDRLADLGIAVYAARTETLAEAARTTRGVGQLLGLAAESEKVLGRIHAALDTVRAAVAGRPAPSVLYVVGLEPLFVAGPGTFVDELLEAAGGRNVFRDAVARWPQVSLEEVVRRQPDAVVLALAEAGPQVGGRLKRTPGWRQLQAVRLGRVFPVDPDVFNRWGPGIPEAARRLARLLHPESFAAEATP